MRKLNINGLITTDPFNILYEQFFQELYTSKNKNREAIESFFIISESFRGTKDVMWQ